MIDGRNVFDETAQILHEHVTTVKKLLLFKMITQLVA